MKDLFKNKFLVFFILFIIFLFFICNDSYCSSNVVSFNYNDTSYTLTSNDFRNINSSFYDEETSFDFFVYPYSYSNGSVSKVRIYTYKDIKPYFVYTVNHTPMLVFLDDSDSSDLYHYTFTYDLSSLSLTFNSHTNSKSGDILFSNISGNNYNTIVESLKKSLSNSYCSNDIYIYNRGEFSGVPEYELVFQRTPVTVGKVTIPEITQVEEIPQVMNKVLEMIIPIGLIVFFVGLLIYLVRLVILRMT